MLTCQPRCLQKLNLLVGREADFQHHLSQPFKGVKSSGLNYRIGLRGPLSPHQVMGIEVEDSFCSILMKRAPVVNSIEELRSWAESLIEDHAKAALEMEEPYLRRDVVRGDFDESFDLELVSQMLRNGISLQLRKYKPVTMLGWSP